MDRVLQHPHETPEDFERFLNNLRTRGYGKNHYQVTTPDKTGHPWEYRIHDTDRCLAINGTKGLTLYLRRGQRYFFTFRPLGTEISLFFTDDPAGGKQGDQTDPPSYEPTELNGTPCSVSRFETVSFVITPQFPKLFYYQDKNHKFLGGTIIVFGDKHHDLSLPRSASSSTSKSNWDIRPPKVRERMDRPRESRPRENRQHRSPSRPRRSPSRAPGTREPVRRTHEHERRPVHEHGRRPTQDREHRGPTRPREEGHGHNHRETRPREEGNDRKYYPKINKNNHTRPHNHHDGSDDVVEIDTRRPR